MPDGPAQLTSAWFDAWRTKDAGAIERMIAPEYVYVAPNGAVLNRDTILGIIRDPSYRIASGTHTEVSVVHLGTEAALVLHHWRGQDTFAGRVFVDDHQCVMVWCRSDGRWRVRYEQASPIV